MNPFEMMFKDQDPFPLGKGFYRCIDGTFLSLTDIAAILPDGLVILDKVDHSFRIPIEDAVIIGSMGYSGAERLDERKKWIEEHSKIKLGVPDDDLEEFDGGD